MDLPGFTLSPREELPIGSLIMNKKREPNELGFGENIGTVVTNSFGTICVKSIKK